MQPDSEEIRAVFARLLPELPVSRETSQRLQRYADLLRHWQKRINLVSADTLDDLITRHFADSAQLLLLAPKARSWLDIGSGAGLPGLVISCFLVDRPGARVDLVESNNKKCAFLRQVTGELGLPAHVQSGRIEEVIPSLPLPEIVTARALASLDMLLGYTNLLLKKGAIGLFPKGRNVSQELTEARFRWHFDARSHPSVTDLRSSIVEIRMSDGEI